MCTNTSSFSLSADKLKLIQHFTNVRAVVLWCNSGSAAVVCSSNVIAPVVAVVGAGVCVCAGAQHQSPVRLRLYAHKHKQTHRHRSSAISAHNKSRPLAAI